VGQGGEEAQLRLQVQGLLGALRREAVQRQHAQTAANALEAALQEAQVGCVCSIGVARRGAA
jgi:hypothetical protein